MDLDQELHPHGAGEAAERFPGRSMVTPLQAGHDGLGHAKLLGQRRLGQPYASTGERNNRRQPLFIA